MPDLPLTKPGHRRLGEGWWACTAPDQPADENCAWEPACRECRSHMAVTAAMSGWIPGAKGGYPTIFIPGRGDVPFLWWCMEVARDYNDEFLTDVVRNVSVRAAVAPQ